MQAIEVKNLTHTYRLSPRREQRALDNINLNVSPGEFFGIAGNNGSGKTTLIRYFNGLNWPEAGEVYVLGNDTRVKEKRLDLWRQVGLAFQFPERQLFAASVQEEIAFGLKNLRLPGKEIERRVEEALFMVGLEPGKILYKSPLTLSGGMRRRVAIACLFAMDPSILVLDEPATGLDFPAREQILSGLKNWQKNRGKTVIMVSHRWDDLFGLCSRVALLEQGQLLACDSPEQLLISGSLESSWRWLPEYLKTALSLYQQGLIDRPLPFTVEQLTAHLSSLLDGASL